ncbi:protoheme IX farnesyltransferase [Striga asiatica]|uniref:Protoheme IX farnesyltransferase n=1 Tax=Striga asiatica TaxID=4170 RepID=A0A5A7QQI1_STRAF|nr:protoheme IX farnesyltransferase [Striga asiatica]
MISTSFPFFFSNRSIPRVAKLALRIIGIGQRTYNRLLGCTLALATYSGTSFAPTCCVSRHKPAYMRDLLRKLVCLNRIVNESALSLHLISLLTLTPLTRPFLCQRGNFRSTSAGLLARFQSPNLTSLRFASKALEMPFVEDLPIEELGKST